MTDYTDDHKLLGFLALLDQRIRRLEEAKADEEARAAAEPWIQEMKAKLAALEGAD